MGTPPPPQPRRPRPFWPALLGGCALRPSACRHPVAERAYKEGDTTPVVVLETTRQLLDAQGREAQLRADVRRAVAELECGVGHRLTCPDVARRRALP